MRRILIGSILASWLAILASVTIGGLGIGDTGLLRELERVLMELPLVPLAFETARAILTGVVMSTLTIVLWAMMIAVTSGADERRDRIVAVAAGFAWVLVVTSVWMVVAAIAGAGGAIAMLLAIQVTTILTMLAAGAVEYAWDARLSESREEEPDSFSVRIARQLASSSAHLASIMPDGRGRERP